MQWLTRSRKVWILFPLQAHPLLFIFSSQAGLPALPSRNTKGSLLLGGVGVGGPVSSCSLLATWLTPHDLQVFVQISGIIKANPPVILFILQPLSHSTLSALSFHFAQYFPIAVLCILHLVMNFMIYLFTVFIVSLSSYSS